MPTDPFADDPRSQLERMLAGDLYIADDPEIARRQQRAVRPPAPHPPRPAAPPPPARTGGRGPAPR
ncbi:maltose acetyltransferase domain-containing protein, partial [Streptomyces sp. NPDC059374]|uniref:maltose acetyltransferase domain-containing protein n=1 Tax=Streptomyces sp. NPDC059374 TaxID=3346814 RepID=UPI0036B90865